MRPGLLGLIAGVVVGGAAVGWMLSSTAPTQQPPATKAQPKQERGTRAQVLHDPPTRRPMKSPKWRLDQTPADPPPSMIGHIAPNPIDTPPRPTTPVAAPSELPNVVVVLGCTVRKDQLSPHGADAAITPTLSAWTESGTIFDDVIAAAPWTRAASIALLTGNHAISLGVVEPGSERNDRALPESAKLLSEYMTEQGYLTLGLTANPNLVAGFGFGQGFDSYQRELQVDWDHVIHGDTAVRNIMQTLASARKRGDNRPAYMQMMLIDAHGPRTALEPEFDVYRVEGEPDRMAQYRYHLRKLDSAVALLEAKLEKQGLTEDNTIFIFATDHGEGLNYPNHHGYAHGQYLTPSTNHVTMIMKGPGVAKGHRIYGPTSQVDLLPTVMGLIDRPVSDEMEGTDLSDLVRGDGHRSPHDQVWTDTWFGESSRAAVFSHQHQCQADFGSSEKQIAKGKFIPGCYDRHADPLYTKPVEQEALMRKLVVWRQARTLALEEMKPERVRVDATLNRQLVELGYKE